MKRLLLALPLAALSVVGLPTSHAFAQDANTARGTVTNIGGSSVTVKVGAQEMKFASTTRPKSRSAAARPSRARLRRPANPDRSSPM